MPRLYVFNKCTWKKFTSDRKPEFLNSSDLRGAPTCQRMLVFYFQVAHKSSISCNIVKEFRISPLLQECFTVIPSNAIRTAPKKYWYRIKVDITGAKNLTETQYPFCFLNM